MKQKHVIDKAFYVLGEKRNIIPILCLFLLNSMLDAVGVGLLGSFASTVSMPQNIQTNYVWIFLTSLYSFDSNDKFIILFGSILVALFLMKGIAAFFVQLTISRYSFGKQGEVILKLTKKYQKIPYKIFTNYNPAQIINATTADTLVYADFLMGILYISSGLMVILCLLCLLAFTDLFATVLVSIILVCVLFMSDKLLKTRAAKYGKDISVSRENIIRNLNDSLIGLKEIRLLNCEGFFLNKISNNANKYAKSSAFSNAFGMIPRYSFEFVMVSFIVLLSWATILRNNNPSQLIATLAIFGAAAIRIIPIASQIGAYMVALRRGVFVINKIYEQLTQDFEEKINIKSTSQSPPTNVNKSYDNRFELRNINFSYPETYNKALDNINIIIPKGQSVGIIGESGAGKSTLIDVLLGMLIPDEGGIYEDGNFVYNDIKQWRSQIAYIPQELFLIQNSIKNNIALGVSEKCIDNNKVISALTTAQLYDFVQTLPHGIDTMVGDRGLKLSGGQRQRIGIARAIYLKRKILIMDEATSAVDVKTEKSIVDEVNALKGEITIIVVAHRLSTIKDCDYVYELSNGKVIKRGLPQSVLETY